MQGDREDRIRIRQQAERQKKRAAAQQEADRLALLPRQLAQAGASEAQIIDRLEREKVSPSAVMALRIKPHRTCQFPGTHASVHLPKRVG